MPTISAYIKPLTKVSLKGTKRGIITSTSLLANGDSFDEAVAMAKENPRLGIGVHTALVGGLKPLSGADKVPSLVDEHGRIFYLLSAIH